MKRILLSLLILASASLANAADYFVRTSGTRLLGRDGKTLVLRGTNCGNWMVREPYMMNTSGNLDRQFKFDKMIADICGEEKVMEFDRLWLDNQFGEADMKFIADHGMNCLRVPMHYKYFTLPIEKEPVAGQQTWLDEGFTRIDSMCVWAERHGILLILDMHACPGGQSSGDICDYDSSKPSLWESEANRTKLVALWRKLAERYKDEKCVVGYDMINETNWSLANSNKMLWDLTKDIIKAIREVDTNHIVIIEGNGYCNDYNGFPSTKMDSKMMLQFHRYWNYGNSGAVQWMADKGTQYSCPVYVGEFGENSNHWVGEHIRLCEEVGKFAAWTVWPMKKTGINSFLLVKRPSAYTNVINKYQDGQKPSATELWNGLVAFAQAQNITKCSQQLDYIDALFHLGFRKPVKPFKEVAVGDYVYCADYDFGDVGQAYWDKDYVDYHSSEDGKYINWNTGWAYRNDGVDLYDSPNDTRSCGYYVGQTADGEWLQYTIDNPNEAAKWSLELRYALNTGTSNIRITVNDREVVPSTRCSSTGGYTTWNTKTFRNIVLPEGKLRVRIYIEKGGLNLNWFRFRSKTTATEEELAVLETDPMGSKALNSNCEYQGAWQVAELGSINNTDLFWNYTTGTPSKGEGGALCIKNAREKALNVAIYQPIEVEKGHIYQANAAVRSISSNKDFWVQAFVTKYEPVNYADKNLEEANTIGQLNTWKNSTLTTFDGMMADKAVAGTSHTAGVMKWKATTTGTMYFVLKVGTNNSSFQMTFDDITLYDLTEIETGIEGDADAKELYTLTGRTLCTTADARIYDMTGRQLQAGVIQPGIYAITNKAQTVKVLVK